jgi:hypothetical protein
MNPALLAVLEPAYRPCAHFSGACSAMRWAPEQGHVPRGFCGATGALEDVRLVLVMAEPGNPHAAERHTGIRSAMEYTEHAFRTGADKFHRNVRALLDLCFTGLSFDEQIRRTWITESVLCSASREGASVPAASWRACGTSFLRAQLSLMPDAVVVALGAKARDRLATLGVAAIDAGAAAPPGCNHPNARAMWSLIASKVAV